MRRASTRARASLQMQGVREILLEIARVSAGDRSDEADVTVADTLKNVELDPCYPKYHDLRA